MNIANLSYTEIQNLRIQADIESFKTGKTVSLYDVLLRTLQIQPDEPTPKPKPKPSTKPVIQKPLPFYFPDDNSLPTKRDNVNMRIRIRNHQELINDSFLLVKESSLVNPDKNIISVESTIGKILRTADLGDTFTLNNIDYSVLEISPSPIKETIA